MFERKLNATKVPVAMLEGGHHRGEHVGGTISTNYISGPAVVTGVVPGARTDLDREVSGPRVKRFQHVRHR
ncbi:hypothetical protein [Streptodolium elevatio]